MKNFRPTLFTLSVIGSFLVISISAAESDEPGDDAQATQMQEMQANGMKDFGGIPFANMFPSFGSQMMTQARNTAMQVFGGGGGGGSGFPAFPAFPGFMPSGMKKPKKPKDDDGEDNDRQFA